MHYEGILMKLDRINYYVGFDLGEVVWKAKPTDNPRVLKESQMFKAGKNRVVMSTKWMEGEINLDRSTQDELVTAFARLKRVK
jgi:hypothetical protein